MKKVIYLFFLNISLALHGMETKEKEILQKTSPFYVFVNAVTFLHPDQEKIEQIMRDALSEQTDLISRFSLGMCSLNDDLRITIKETLFSMLKEIDVNKSSTFPELYIDDQRPTPPIFHAFCTASTDEEATTIYEQIKEHFKTQENPFKKIPSKNKSWIPNFIVKSYDSFFSCPDTKFTLLLEALDLFFNNTRRNTILKLCPQTFPILKEVCENGNFKIIVTANMSASCCHSLLKKHEIYDLFKETQTSDKIGYVTPQKEFYETYLKTYNILPDQCIVIEEHKENLIGAKNLGMQTLHKYQNEKFYEQLKTVLLLKKELENS